MAPQNKPRKHGDLDVQAQEAFYQRSSGPVIGQRPVDQSPKKLAALQHIGAIPGRYTSWEQINDEFRYNVEVLGLTEQQTRDKLNLNVKNTNGKYYFSKYERYGAGNYINFREISTDLQPETIADLLQINKMVERAQGPRLKSPEQMLEDAVFAEEDEWGDRPKNKHNKNIVSSKERANATRDAIRERLGGPPKGSPDVYDSGKQVHRGHGFAASKSNAGLAADNIWDELGSYNVYGHAGKSNNPRIHPDILFEVNAPPTAEFAAWYRDPELRKQRLYPGVPDQLMMAADEYGSEIYGSRGSGRKKTYTVGPATTRGGVINTPPETVPAKADKLLQISSQLAAEQVNRDIEAGKVSFQYERGNEASKKKADEARAKYTETVRQSIAKPYLDQQSINLDPTSSPNTPITKSTYQFTEKDFTPLQWKEFTAGGGNAAIAQGKKVTEIIDKGRIARRNPNLMPTTPTRVIPSRLDKGLSGAGPIQTRPSPSQIAASIATREPLPTPKPQPKVGQPAVLNGKPVIWSGGKWMPVPAPKAKLTDTLPKDPTTAAARLARNVAPMWASVPLSAALAGQSIKAAVTTPNPDTIETAAWDTANLLADAATFVPIPIISGAAEGVQKTLGITQAAREGQKFVSKQAPKQKPTQPVNRLSPQQIESFRAGGGNAAMSRYGLTIQQVIERGSQARLNKS